MAERQLQSNDIGTGIEKEREREREITLNKKAINLRTEILK